MQFDSVSFEGQTIVITGAASGIGRSAAKLISARGGKVFILDIAPEGLRTLQRDLSLPSEQVFSVDMGDQYSIMSVIARIHSQTGQIDAAVNAAGIVGPTNTHVEDVIWAEFENTFRVNLFGAVWLTQALLPFMKARKYGRIVHVASIAGKEGNPGMSPYNTSKSGMIGFIKGVAKEVAAEGITINAVAPAVIRTPMNVNTSEDTLKYMIARIPVGRVGEPEEVAELLAFVASRACSFTTGFTFDISGGRATY
jgi:NAD(P)-dependent dehydrogenase (short-subunit alcohol dehydrogenase family)